jgi:hypothetical protein
MKQVAVLRRQMLSAALFWALVGLSAAMVVLLLLLLGGIVPVGPPAATPATGSDSAARPAPPRAGTTAIETEAAPAASTTAPGATTTAPPDPGPALVVLTATRGECWFQARLGSETGRVLDERVLGVGESARFEGHRIWLVVGAAGNVELTVDGQPQALSPGTVSVTLTPPPRSSPTS